MLRLHLYPNWDVCLWTSWHLCVYNSEFVFSLSSLLIWRVSVWQNTYHVTVGKRNLLHTAPFKAPSPISQPFQTPLSVAWGNGAEFDGGLIFFPLRCLLSPQALDCNHYTSGQQTAPMHWLHRATVNRERVVGKGKRSWQEWLSHWWVTDEIFGPQTHSQKTNHSDRISNPVWREFNAKHTQRTNTAHAEKCMRVCVWGGGGVVLVVTSRNVNKILCFMFYL